MIDSVSCVFFFAPLRLCGRIRLSYDMVVMIAEEVSRKGAKALIKNAKS
jgi:hypothetical protein